MERGERRDELLRAVTALRQQVAELARVDSKAQPDTCDDLDLKLRRFQDAVSDGALARDAWHDIGNLLYGILAYAEGVRREVDTEKGAREAAAAVIDSARQALELIRLARDRRPSVPERAGERQSDAPGRAVEPVPTAVGGAANTGAILVIDSDPVVLKVVRDMLETLGRYSVGFRDLDMALAHFRQHFEETDLVILNSEMAWAHGPESLDPFRRIDPRVRVLLGASRASDEAAVRLLEAGASGLILRPFTLTELSEAVDRAVA